MQIEKQRLIDQIRFCNDKLSNPLFLSNAKPEVVEKERQKLKDFTHKLEVLNNPLTFMVKDTKFEVKRLTHDANNSAL